MQGSARLRPRSAACICQLFLWRWGLCRVFASGHSPQMSTSRYRSPSIKLCPQTSSHTIIFPPKLDFALQVQCRGPLRERRALRCALPSLELALWAAGRLNRRESLTQKFRSKKSQGPPNQTPKTPRPRPSWESWGRRTPEPRGRRIDAAAKAKFLTDEPKKGV